MNAPASSAPASHEIRQIYYDQRSQAALDPGFIPLDNTANERADWREYWPISQYLRSTELHEDRRYGFFSPKFFVKTGLQAKDVHSFLEAHPQADVVLFSPFPDQSCATLNVIEQCGLRQPEFMPLFQRLVDTLWPGTDALGLIMSSQQTVFCNYFVARPSFWRRWLEICGHIVSWAETTDSAFHEALNASATYSGTPAQNKVFVIERIASLLLTLEPVWRCVAHPPFAGPLAAPSMLPYRIQLLQLEALKLAYQRTGWSSFMDMYGSMRRNLIGH